MQAVPPGVLAVNVGSSSLKVRYFSLEDAAFSRKARFEKIGSESAEWELENRDGQKLSGRGRMVRAADAVPLVGAWLDGERLAAIAHRFVHSGPDLASHTIIDGGVLTKLRRAKSLAPEHLPIELEMVEAMRRLAPEVPQIACFDTVFHAALPASAGTFALPRRLRNAGVRRFGFHGLSYEYLAEWLKNRGSVEARSIFAHLGNGASMAAVLNGKCVDTTMGLTPAGGLVMGTRSGDLDPGVFRFLAAELGMSAAEIDRAVSHESGLRGLSETSSDVRDLLAARRTDPRAALALEVFCHSAKKHLCALVAVLGGTDQIVFTGGIGEHSPEIRTGILSGLDFLGVRLDSAANAENRELISAPHSAVAIHVVPADEETTMFRIANDLLSLSTELQTS